MYKLTVVCRKFPHSYSASSFRYRVLYVTSLGRLGVSSICCYYNDTANIFAGFILEAEFLDLILMKQDVSEYWIGSHI